LPTPGQLALTTIEAGAAGSFLWLLSFAEKESDALAASDTKESKPYCPVQFGIATLSLAMTRGEENLLFLVTNN